MFFLFGVAMSNLNVVIFAGQPAGQEPLKIDNLRRSPAGLIDRLPVGSGHENVDRFHL